MNINKKDLGILIAIVFASSVISGSLVFLGTLLVNRTPESVTVENIEKALESFQKKLQDKQLEVQQKSKADKNLLAKNLEPVSKDDHIRGNKNAKISLVEYSDFECPYCKAFHVETLKLLEAYPNDINLVYRHFPLSFHEPMATKEAIASECVNELGGNDKFWQFADLVFERTTSNGKGLDDEKISQIVNDVGLSQSKFNSCYTSGKFDAKIKQQIQDGDKAGVTGTPGDYLKNNQTGDVVVLDGYMTFDDMKQVVEPMLK